MGNCHRKASNNHPINTKNKSTMSEEPCRPTTAAGGRSYQGGDTTLPEPEPPRGQIVTPNLKIFTYAELRGATKNFRPNSIVGEGGFGQVYKGWVDGVTYAPSKAAGVGIPVAVKKSDSGSFQGLKEWQAEVGFLGKFSHPNLVKLLGYCWQDQDFLLVYEYMQKGSLEKHLFKKDTEPLSWETRMKIAMGAAQGLAFLHTTERKVIYRDFKSSNILLDGKQHEDDNCEQKNSSLSSSLDRQADRQCRQFSLAEIKSATNGFDDAFVIGKGGFGKVYKGRFNNGVSTDVAIKRLNLDSNQGASEFWTEIEMLSKFRHSHIVSLLGYCEKEMILVYEYMPNGSLEDHLHKKRANRSNSSPLTWVQRLNICIGAARGLDYLHTGTGAQCRVIHRDVKSSNVLPDDKLTAKISDFGLSRIGPACQPGSTTNVYTDQIKGTFGYMDAEYFSTRRLTRKSDVYAFGVVLLEVLCGRPALDFTLDEQQHSLAEWARQCIKEGKTDQIIDPSLRGQAESNCLKEFGQIAYECILNSSKDRPTMTKVLARLEFVLSWTLQSVQRATNRKHIGKSMFIDKAWSMFLPKGPRRMSLNMKKLGQSIGNKKKNFMMAEGGGGQLVVAHMGPQNMIPKLKMFTYSELKTATKNFGQKMFLGEGGYGKVFIGWLDSVTLAPLKVGDGLAVAIKMSSFNRVQGLNEWQTEVKFLGTFSHPNVIKLYGYCWENKNCLLVYEFMQKGSLDMHLFREGVEPLPWHTRVNIAMGAAQGLAFLHTTENNVICRDVKSSNILLDKDFNAKLSDFGLAKLGPVNGESHVSTSIAGTYGYMAPEYMATGRLYVKSDVYAFGVVMLEIITGLRASDYNYNGKKRNLVEWAKPFLINIKKLKRITDPRLYHDYPTKGVVKAAELILSCLESEPKNRPSMKEVVLALQGINKIKMKPGKSKSK